MQCKHCGAEVTGNFCPQCGEPAEPLLHQCPVCGKEREEGSNFCTVCGYNFEKQMRHTTPLKQIALEQQPQALPSSLQNTADTEMEKDKEQDTCAYVQIRRYMHMKRWIVFFFFVSIFIVLNCFLLEHYRTNNLIFVAVAASVLISIILLIIALSPIRKWSPKKIKSFGLAFIAIFSLLLIMYGIVYLTSDNDYYFSVNRIIILLTIFLGQPVLFAFTTACLFNMTKKLKLSLYGTEEVKKSTKLLPQYDPFDFEKIKQEYAELRGKKTVQADGAAYRSAQALSAAPAGAAGAGPSFGHITLYDTIVHKKDWKSFRKHATQAELAVLAIGSRSRLTGPRFFIKSVIAVAGMILSIVFGLAYTFSEYMQFGLILLIGGYLFFNLLASKQIGYSDTYSSCYGKLSGEYSKMVKELFKEHIALTILRQIILIFLRIITIPYQFILMIIETLIPPAANWTVAHGGNAGAVITLPKGYNIGNLAALGEYYASSTFGAAWEEHMENTEAARLAKFSQYEYFDKNGMRQTAYSDDGRTFYTSTDKLQEVGTSDDGGKTIELK